MKITVMRGSSSLRNTSTDLIINDLKFKSIRELQDMNEPLIARLVLLQHICDNGPKMHAYDQNLLYDWKLTVWLFPRHVKFYPFRRLPFAFLTVRVSLLSNFKGPAKAASPFLLRRRLLEESDVRLALFVHLHSVLVTLKPLVGEAKFTQLVKKLHTPDLLRKSASVFIV